MKIIKSGLVIMALLLTTIATRAQRIKVVNGDANILKNETSVNIEFEYEGMSVGKYDKEADYIRAKTDEYNKKEPGRGDTWAKNWVTDRKSRFEPKFIELFQESTGMTVSSNAKYTIIFKTTSTEPGYNVVISRKNAEIDGEARIVETADRSKTLTQVTISNVPGRIYGGYDYDTGSRIAECYAMAGKKLGKFFK